MIPSNATPPTAIIDQVEGSGTDVTASPSGLISPVIKLALITAPVVALSSPTVVPPFSRREEVVARQGESAGPFSPVMKLALIVAVVASYISQPFLIGAPGQHRAAALARFWAWSKGRRCAEEVCKARSSGLQLM